MEGRISEKGSFYWRKKKLGYNFLPAQRTEEDGSLRLKCTCPMSPFKSWYHQLIEALSLAAYPLYYVK
jgi:hypothetical protein